MYFAFSTSVFLQVSQTKGKGTFAMQICEARPFGPFHLHRRPTCHSVASMNEHLGWAVSEQEAPWPVRTAPSQLRPVEPAMQPRMGLPTAFSAPGPVTMGCSTQRDPQCAVSDMPGPRADLHRMLCNDWENPELLFLRASGCCWQS